MLFNSIHFIFIFLPLTYFAYTLTRRYFSVGASIHILLLSSMLFYGYWYPPSLLLFVLSILFNYVIGIYFIKDAKKEVARRYLIIGIATNLVALGYFKYLAFFVQNLNLLGYSIPRPEIILPIGISFYTFQQIAFLADCYQKKLDRWLSLRDYSLFVSFFPQLIAGPIVHHASLVPQFERRSTHFVPINIALGLSFFSIGLFKKTIIADTSGIIANQVFNTAKGLSGLTAADAWLGTIAYTNQIYFDFSGYSEMAIGLGLLFNIHLPINFYSPYKASSIVDFWRRWHITLSAFLKDYLYIPLGGNRKGKSRRYLNLMITMLLGGFWHGASWTFVIWGGIHGVCLAINHFWNDSRIGTSLNMNRNFIYRLASHAITLLIVMVAWIFFRATSASEAFFVTSKLLDFSSLHFGHSMIENISMIGKSSLMFLISDSLFGEANPKVLISGFVALTLSAALFLPNTVELLKYSEKGSLESSAQAIHLNGWKGAALGFIISMIFLLGVLGLLSGESEFLYFQF